MRMEVTRIRNKGVSKRSNKPQMIQKNYWANTESTSRYLMKILVEFVGLCTRNVRASPLHW
jgi:hypothetical protein